MHTDAFGFTHPDTTDQPSLVGALHIAECGMCQKEFGPGVTEQCIALGEAYLEDRKRAPLAL